MTISYFTKRGAHMTRRIEPSALEAEISKMTKRRIECRAKDDDGTEVGAVWKDAGRWHWYFDRDAMNT
jgi:hypothetical protein